MFPSIRSRSPLSSSAPGLTPEVKPPEVKPPEAKPPEAKPQWGTALSYRFDGEAPNLHSHPKGWNLDTLAENGPPQVSRISRQEGSEPGSGQSSLFLPQPKKPLEYYMDNFGRQAVQNRLPSDPAHTRPASPGEAMVGRDFASAIEAARLQGADPREGEFIATYLKTTGTDTDRPSVHRQSLDYFQGRSSHAPLLDREPDYAIHSHPFDPENPGGYPKTHPLGAGYPSGKDYLEAQRGARGPERTKEMLLHGKNLNVIHPEDLRYTRVVPPEA